MSRRVRIAVYTRVSTDEQAEKPESSLDNQEHRCRTFLTAAGNHDATEIRSARVYREEGYSGKDTNRPEFQRLMRDIRSGKVDVLVFTELSRISRSVSDFLTLSQFLEDQGVEFISLKERFDTTTPHGKLIMVVLVALYQFERETTAARTKAAMRDRAERGLWSGGNIPTGYRPDPERSGHLLQTEESAIVEAAFRLYLELGGRAPVLKALEAQGFMLAEKLSRRGKVTPRRKITDGVLAYMLQNPTYIGLKEVNLCNKGLPEEEALALPEKDRYYTVPGAWEPIIEIDTWDPVQQLRAKNRETFTNNVRPKQHDYVLQGILRCGDCGGVLHGCSTHKEKNGERTYYFYYQHYGKAPKRCSRKSIPAERVEKLVIERLRDLATQRRVLDKLVAETNRRIETGVPDQEKALTAARRDLASLEREQVEFTARLMSAPAGAIPAFLWEKANELQQQVDAAKARVEQEVQRLEDIQGASLDAEEYRKLLREFNTVYEAMNPHEKQVVLGTIIDDLTVTKDELRLRLVGPEAGVLSLRDFQPERLVQPAKWLPSRGLATKQTG